MAESVGLDINIKFANVKEEIGKLVKEANKSVFKRPGQYQAGISKALDELPSIMIRTKAQNEKMFNAFFKNVYSKLKGLFPDLDDKELNKLSTSFANQGVKLIRKAQAQEIKDTQDYYARLGRLNEKAKKKKEKDDFNYTTTTRNKIYKQFKKDEADFHKYAKESPEETSRADWEWLQTKTKKEKEYEDLKKYFTPSEEEQKKLDEDFEYRKKLSNQESIDKKKQEEKYRKQQAKDEKERQKRFLMFFGKWGTYGFAINKAIGWATKGFNLLNQTGQEALSWQRLENIGAAGSGFGAGTAQMQRLGFGKDEYKKFMTELALNKGRLKLGIGGNAMMAWLTHMSPDTDTPEEMFQSAVKAIKALPDDSVALAIGELARMKPDLVSAIRSGEYDEAAKGAAYSTGARDWYANVGRYFNRTLTNLKVGAYNQGAIMLQGLYDDIRGIGGSPFSPSGIINNLIKYGIKAKFGAVNVTINNTDGTITKLEGKAEETNGDITFDTSKLDDETAFQQLGS